MQTIRVSGHEDRERNETWGTCAPPTNCNINWNFRPLLPTPNLCLSSKLPLKLGRNETWGNWAFLSTPKPGLFSKLPLESREMVYTYLSPSKAGERVDLMCRRGDSDLARLYYISTTMQDDIQSWIARVERCKPTFVYSDQFGGFTDTKSTTFVLDVDKKIQAHFVDVGRKWRLPNDANQRCGYHPAASYCPSPLAWRFPRSCCFRDCGHSAASSRPSPLAGKRSLKIRSTNFALIARRVSVNFHEADISSTGLEMMAANTVVLNYLLKNWHLQI